MPIAQQYFEIRSRNINKLRESQDPSPYPHKFSVNTNLKDFAPTHNVLKSGEVLKDVEIRVAGRIYNKRASGTKLVFYDIRSEGVKVQIMVGLLPLIVTHYKLAQAVARYLSWFQC